MGKIAPNNTDEARVTARKIAKNFFLGSKTRYAKTMTAQVINIAGKSLRKGTVSIFPCTEISSSMITADKITLSSNDVK